MDHDSNANREPESLDELLDRVCDAGESGEDDVSLGMIMERVGPRSYGSVLLVAGLVTVAPLVGDIPGVPTIMAALVLLTAVQLLLRREAIWLPRFLEKRSVSAEKVRKAVSKVRKPARAVDRVLRPRLTALVRGPGAYAVAAACVLIALALPPMELIPFSANLAGAALTGFGLALIARDGLVAALAFAFTGGVAAVVITQLGG